MRISQQYLPAQVFDKYVLLPVGQKIMEREKSIELNKTGYEIVTNLLENLSYDQLLGILLEKFQIHEEDRESFAREIGAFLDDLRNKGIIVD